MMGPLPDAGLFAGNSVSAATFSSYAVKTVAAGLYAAGEVTWQSGGYSQSVVFGKIAGRHAAAAK